MENKKREGQDKGNLKDWIFEKGSTIMAVLAVVLSIVALILAMVLPNHSENSSHNQELLPDKETDCFNCTNLLSQYINSMTSPLDVENADTSGKPCCAENIEDLSTLLQKALQVQETISGNKQKDNTNNNPTSDKLSESVVAHKSFSHTKGNSFCKKNKDIKEVDMEIVIFNTGTPKILFEVVKNIDVKEDGLEIKHPGMYYVYSSFKYHSNLRHTKDLKTWHQYVFRDRKGFCESLLKTTHTTCQDCSQSKDTAFVGGVFHLVSGDVLRVLVSKQESLDFKTEDSYLGALMLSAQ